jgi:uncharacterized protein (TIGR03000 family)
MGHPNWYSSPSLFLGDELSVLPGRNYTPGREGVAHIRLHVPADADVWFDDTPTKQTGVLRVFTSPPLPPGKRFVYDVRVRWTKDGRSTEVTRRIPVHAYDRVTLDLTRPNPERSPGTAVPAKPAR